MTTPGKLVRDRIPEIVAERGHRATTRRLEPSERLPALLAKLDEETAELREADGLDHQAEEIADVHEVLLAIATELGLAWDDIERIAADKRAERGGFEQGVWMVTESDDA